LRNKDFKGRAAKNWKYSFKFQGSEKL